MASIDFGNLADVLTQAKNAGVMYDVSNRGVNSSAGGRVAPGSTGAFSPTGFIGQAAHALGSAASYVGHSLTDGFTGLAGDIKSNLNIRSTVNNANNVRSQLDARSSQLDTAYKHGKISKADYRKATSELAKQYTDLSSDVGEAESHRAGYGQVGGHVLQAGTAALTLAAPLVTPELTALGGAVDLAKPAITPASRLALMRAAAAQNGGELTPEMVQATKRAADIRGATSARLAVGKGVKIVGDTIGAGQSTGAGGRVLQAVTGAPGKVVRNAVLSQPTAQFAADTGVAAAHGDWNKVGENAALAAGGSALTHGLPAAAKVLKNTFMNSHGLFDRVVLSGGKTVNQHLADLTEQFHNGDISKNEYQKTVDQLKVAQDHILAQHGGNIEMAAKHLQSYQGDEYHNALEHMNLKQFVKQQGDFQNAAKKFTGDVKNLHTADGEGGFRPLTNEEAVSVRPGKATQSDKSQIANRLSEAAASGNGITGTALEAKRLKAEFPNFFKNANNTAKIDHIVSHETDPIAIKNRINNEIIGTNSLVKLNKDTGEFEAVNHQGYHPIIGPQSAAPVRDAKEVGDLVSGHKAPLGFVGEGLRKSGLSPEGTNNALNQSNIKDNFVSHLTQSVPEISEIKAKAVYNQLQKAATATRGVYDTRLLSNRAVETVLDNAGISPDARGAVTDALNQATTDLSVGERGLGAKVTDHLIKTLPPFRAYLKAQSYGKFAINPFFQLLKVPIKGEYLAQAMTGGVRPFGPVKSEVNQWVKGKFDPFGDVGLHDIIGGNAKNVRPGIAGTFLQNVAGNVVQQTLKNNGISLAELSSNPKLEKELTHSVETIFGYPKGGFLDSNMAKTLNVVVFPARFEIKVASASAHFLAQQNVLTRAAMVGQIAHANDWAQSDAGKEWAKANPDLNQVMGYFSPVASLSHVMNSLADPAHLKPSDLGELGGLPFGVITTILQHQSAGINNALSSVEQNPRTGQNYTTNIPQSDKARFQQGIIDLMGSMFSWPGQTMGLTSKTNLIKDAVPGLKINAGETKTINESAPTTSSVPSLRPLTPSTVKSPIEAARVERSHKVPKAKTARGAKTKHIAQPL